MNYTNVEEAKKSSPNLEATLKTSEIENRLAEILQNYNHPLFERAYELIADQNFSESEEETNVKKVKVSD